METRANYVAVGLFVLVVLTGALGFVYWLYSTGNTTQRTPIEILFDDPVTGLSVGSPVVFNGIRIGEVSQLGFVSPDSPTVLARAQVDRNAPLKTDTKAELGVQGLTGVSYVSLSGGKRDSPSLFAGDEIPEITAQRSAIQDLLQGARSILEKTDSTIANINALVDENKDKISRTVSNVETFSQALAQNSDKIDRLLVDISDAGAAIANVAPHVESLVSRADTLVAEVQPEDVRRIVGNVTEFTDRLGEFSGNVTQVVDAVTAAATDLQQFASGLNVSLQDVDTLIKSVDPETVKSIFAQVNDVATVLGGRSQDIDQFIADARSSADNVRSLSETLRDQRQDIQQIIASTRSVTERADTLVGSLQPAAEQIGRVAAAVNPEAIGQIVEQVQSLSAVLGGRSQDIDRFIADASASAQNVRTVTQSFAEQNEDIQQIIASTRSVTSRADTFIASLQPAAEQLDTLMGAVDTAKVQAIVDNVRQVSQAIADRSGDITSIIVDAKDTAASARAFADRLDAQKETVDQVAQNAREISDKLNAASTRVNQIVDNVGTMVEGDGQGLIKEATEAARAIKVVAQAFESRAGTISSGLERFSTTGVDDFRGVMTQARQTLQEIERAFSNIDRDPSRVIFGGPNGPRYQPQRR
ncbi:MlaD family protein [Amorphus coralli]|uniref:MlaD family protein n=1 Tax=Amorphus coralli TaxID=340680 RepID=UPI0003643A01|nr:MlaD family protein [Amorphus coralli]